MSLNCSLSFIHPQTTMLLAGPGPIHNLGPRPYTSLFQHFLKLFKLTKHNRIKPNQIKLTKSNITHQTQTCPIQEIINKPNQTHTTMDHHTLVGVMLTTINTTLLKKQNSWLEVRFQSESNWVQQHFSKLRAFSAVDNWNEWRGFWDNLRFSR